jgi:YfiH family protein
MLERRREPSGQVWYRSPALARRGVPHAFPTRLGPEGAEFGRLSLDEGQRRDLPLLCGLAAGTPLVWAKQVHGRQALEVGPEGFDVRQEADALWTRQTDRLLMVFSADCVPVLVCSADGQRVAAIHAGWRGLVAGAIHAALGDWARGGSAAIGPCLGVAHAQMGPEVLERFRAAELEPAIVHDPGEQDRVDVRLAARLQLERCGLAEIDISPLCTYAQGDELYSYRREVTHGGRAATGRLFGLIARPAARR